MSLRVQCFCYRKLDHDFQYDVHIGNVYILMRNAHDYLGIQVHMNHVELIISLFTSTETLKVFSLVNVNFMQPIDAVFIKKMIQLEYLNLEKVEFVSKNENQLYNILTLLKNFQTLRHLNLCKYQQMYPSYPGHTRWEVNR